MRFLLKYLNGIWIWTASFESCFIPIFPLLNIIFASFQRRCVCPVGHTKKNVRRSCTNTLYLLKKLFFLKKHDQFKRFFCSWFLLAKKTVKVHSSSSCASNPGTGEVGHLGDMLNYSRKLRNQVCVCACARMCFCDPRHENAFPPPPCRTTTLL